MPEDRSVLSLSAAAPSREWVYGPRPDTVADIYLPDHLPSPDAGTPGRAVVLLVHGGFWRPEYDRTHLRPMAAALAVAGYPTLLVEYARTPGDPDAGLADLRLALSRLTDAGLPDRHVVMAGHSAGGHLALVASGWPGTPIGACLALAPVADLVGAEDLGLDGGAVPDYLGGPAGSRPDLDPRRLAAAPVPVTILHGTDDTLVPVHLSRSYAEARPARVVTPACGHFELIDPRSAAWPVVLAELSALTSPSGIE